MTDLTQRARKLADTFANGMFAGHAELYRDELTTFLLAALSDVRREALAVRALADTPTSDAEFFEPQQWSCACGWRGVMSDAPMNPSGHKVCPKCGGSGGLIRSVEAARLTPSTAPPDPRDAEIERLREVVRAMGWQAIEDVPKDGTFLLARGRVYHGLPFPAQYDPHELFPDRPWVNLLSHTRLYDHVLTEWMTLPEVARQTLDRDPPGAPPK